MARKTKHNSLTTPEQIAKINSQNKRLVSDYLSYLKSVQRAQSTINQYEHDLNIFFVWNSKYNDNKIFTNLSKRDIVSFQNWLIDNNENGPARVRRIKSVLSSLSAYIENILDDEYEGYRSIVGKIENPKNQAVREKTVFSAEQLQSLLDRLIDLQQYDKACALALGIFSGRRKSELLRFKVEYFNEDNLIFGGSLYKTPEKIRTKGAGKGKYIYCYVLAKEFKPYLDMWMSQRKCLGIESEWLFPDKSNPNEHMKISTLNSYARTFTNMLDGIDFYWHSLRHYFTTYLSKEGVPNSVIKFIIGWESSQMCDTYNDTTADEFIGEYFNENGIVKKESKSLFGA
jgi:integrase